MDSSLAHIPSIQRENTSCKFFINLETNKWINRQVKHNNMSEVIIHIHNDTKTCKQIKKNIEMLPMNKLK